MADISMQDSVRRAREEAQRQLDEMNRQQEESRRRMEEMSRQTQVGQASQVGVSGNTAGGGMGGGLSGGSPPMSMISKFMGNGAGSAAGGGGGAAGGAGGGGGGAGALGAAGPWAALAAVIAGNEYSARKAGRRDDRKATHLMDSLTGKVLEQDMDYYGGKVGGIGGEVLKGVGQLGNPEGTFNLVKRIFK